MSTSPADPTQTRNRMVEQARELVPALRERRSETDALRSLPKASVQDILDLGIVGVAAPAELGGGDLGADVILDVAFELGRGCGATAWCAGNWAVHSVFAAMFSAQAQEELFADGKAPLMATGFSPLRAQTKPTDGGAMISGQWDFVSGIDSSDWIVINGMTETGPLAHLVPASDVTIIDTWHTTGLRGTGSKDVAAQDLFVPEHRLLGLGGPSEGQSLGAELYQNPWLKLPLAVTFPAGIIGTILGLATGAFEVFLERTTQNIGGLSGIRVSTRPEVQHKMGQSSADIGAAHVVAQQAFAGMKHKAENGIAVTMDDRLDFRRDIGWSAKTATAAVTRLYEVGGAHSLFQGDQLEQFNRDIVAASHHYGVAWDLVFSGYGRHLVGQEAGIPMT
jgi:alkylation response protein AidB-like acyl-CoA dehydrogenase